MPMLAKESTSIQGDVNPLPSFLESMRGGDRTNGEAAGENGDGGEPDGHDDGSAGHGAEGAGGAD